MRDPTDSSETPAIIVNTVDMGGRAVTDAPAEALDTDESPETARKLEVDTVDTGVKDVSVDDKGAAPSNPVPLLRRRHSDFFCNISKQNRISQQCTHI